MRIFYIYIRYILAYIFSQVNKFKRKRQSAKLSKGTPHRPFGASWHSSSVFNLFSQPETITALKGAAKKKIRNKPNCVRKWNQKLNFKWAKHTAQGRRRRGGEGGARKVAGWTTIALPLGALMRCGGWVCVCVGGWVQPADRLSDYV